MRMATHPEHASDWTKPSNMGALEVTMRATIHVIVGVMRSREAAVARRTKKNLHVPLDEQLHARLVAQTQRVRAPVTTVAREAIEAWTAEAERQARQDAMRAYAEAMAASGADLDEDLEAAAASNALDATR